MSAPTSADVETLSPTDHAALLAAVIPIIDIALSLSLDIGGRNDIAAAHMPPTLGLDPTRGGLAPVHFADIRAWWAASDEKREAWGILDAATRLQLAGQVEFPARGTIRRLRLAEDSVTGRRWAELGYTRGGHDPDAPPWSVITASDEAVATLIRLLDAETPQGGGS